MIRTIAAAILTFTFGANTAQADSIAIMQSVTLAPDVQTVTLGDVAKLTGEHAQRYTDVVLTTIDDPAQPMTITIGQVRKTLSAAGAHWGLIDLNGCKADVRCASRLAGAPQAMTGATIGEVAQTLESSATDNNSLRANSILRQRNAASIIAATLAQQLRLDPARLRLTFDTKDQEFLSLPTAQYRFEIQPTSSFEADRVILQIRAWHNGRIALQQTVHVDVEVHVTAGQASRDIRRGAVLDANDVQTTNQWVQGSMVREMISPADLAGRIATTSLKQDDLIRLRDVKKQTLIERGDVVQVRCLVGGVALTMQAEARTDGSEGDTIEFRKLGERETFLAQVTGRNQAIVDLAR